MLLNIRFNLLFIILCILNNNGIREFPINNNLIVPNNDNYKINTIVKFLLQNGFIKKDLNDLNAPFNKFGTYESINLNNKIQKIEILNENNNIEILFYRFNDNKKEIVLLPAAPSESYNNFFLKIKKLYNKKNVYLNGVLTKYKDSNYMRLSQEKRRIFFNQCIVCYLSQNIK